MGQFSRKKAPQIAKLNFAVLAGGAPRSRRKLLRLAALGLLAFMAACSSTPGAVPKEAVASAMAEFRGYATQTAEALPTETSTPTPTEIPDPFKNVVLPEGSGSLQKEGESWIFNSPLTAEVGKNVPVQILEHTYEDGIKENWIALVAHPEWPLFIQNESGGWETALEYVEVKKPLVDAQGTPIPLTCEFFIDGGRSYLGCFMVANGEPFAEGDMNYLPVAVSMDGKFDSPMYTNGFIPFEEAKYDKAVYPGRVYNAGSSTSFALSGEILGSIVKGDVFWVQAQYDRQNVDSYIEKYRNEGLDGAVRRLTEMKKNTETVKQVFEAIKSRIYNHFMAKRLNLWVSFYFGVGR